MRRIVFVVSVVLAAILLLPAFSRADSFTFSWGEQNGPSTYPTSLDAGSQLFSVPDGQTITDATFTSTFGNSTVPSTAVMDVFINSVLVGSCYVDTQCWSSITTPTPFSYTFTSTDLSALTTGSVDLSINQTDCCVIRLGSSTLTIDTAPTTPTPEPASVALLGSGLAGLMVMRKRRARA